MAGFVLLNSGVVGDIACLLVARTIDPWHGKKIEPTYLSFVLSTNNAPKRGHNGLVMVIHISLSPCHRLMLPLVSLLPLMKHLLRHLPSRPLCF